MEKEKVVLKATRSIYANKKVGTKLRVNATISHIFIGGEIEIRVRNYNTDFNIPRTSIHALDGKPLHEGQEVLADAKFRGLDMWGCPDVCFTDPWGRELGFFVEDYDMHFEDKPMPKYSISMAWAENDGAYIASVPELPGCTADGETPAIAVRKLEIATEEWLETAREEGREIPEPRLYENVG